MTARKLTPEIGHFAGLILKELFVPQADNGLKTCHIRFRCLIAFNWQEANAHELAYSLGELVRMLDSMWTEVQRLYPDKDWKSIRSPDDWEDLQRQIDADLA